MVNKDYQYLSI